MRYFRIISITFFIILFFSLTFAEDIYMWTDEEGVVHITNNPRGLPSEGDVERIRHRDRDDSDKQSLSDKGQDIGLVTEKAEEKEAISDQTGKPPEEEPRHKELDREIGRAREEYDRTRELVERRRRDYSRNSTRHNRDQYRHALKILAEKRERLRDLMSQK